MSLNMCCVVSDNGNSPYVDRIDITIVVLRSALGDLYVAFFPRRVVPTLAVAIFANPCLRGVIITDDCNYMPADEVWRRWRAVWIHYAWIICDVSTFEFKKVGIFCHYRDD